MDRADKDDSAGEEGVPVEVGAGGISFKGKVNPTTAAMVKRIHQNLGHPPNRELVRHLRLSGASQCLVQAAQQLVCRTCQQSTKARPAKVASPATYLDFNEALAIDIIWLETLDSIGATVPALNVVDMASTYQQVIPMAATKSGEAARALVSGWTSWAGTPKHITADLDSAFKSDFLAEMDNRGIAVRCAGTSPLAEWSRRKARCRVEADLGEGDEGTEHTT